MPDKKLTDSEIVKALECCIDSNCCKENCPIFDERDSLSLCTSKLSRYALDLINRLQAENTVLLGKIEDLEANRVELLENIEQLESVITQIKADAYKECIEKAKSKIDRQPHSRSLEASGERFRVHKILDNLLKELGGEDNA